MIKQYPRPELGTWHTITERAIKTFEGNQRRWITEPIDEKTTRGKWIYKGEGEPVKPVSWGNNWAWEPHPPITEYRAMYIGYRYKSNGEWLTRYHCENWETADGWEEEYYSNRETVEVWLFVTHDNRNPIAVFPFDWMITP